jgi:hypothetical protein
MPSDTNIITEIRGDVKYLIKEFDDFNNRFDRALTRISDLEIAQAKQGEKVSNWNLFQASFSVIVGAIAAYLGVQKQ